MINREHKYSVLTGKVIGCAMTVHSALGNGFQEVIYQVDFLVEGVVSVELKAIIQLDDVHLAQAINYLEAFDLEVGLLINFGAKSLEFKRVTNKTFKQQNQGNPKIL